jgi:8-oxo-dGTP pyrophosphatase MutT (NUDIX family)
MPARAKTLLSKEIFRGRVVRLTVDTIELPNGYRADFEIVHHPGGAAIVALDAERRVCLLHQERPAAGGAVWELPAGRLEPGEPPAETARRELIEEAGVEAANWLSLGISLSSPGVFDERIHLFLATGLTAVADRREAFEVFAVHWLPLDDALRRCETGEIEDSKTCVALLRTAAKLRDASQPSRVIAP